MKTKKLLDKIISEELFKHLNEESAISTVADDAFVKFMDIIRKTPSVIQFIDKLKIKPSGSFFSIMLTDKRGNSVELIRTPVEQVAKNLLPVIQNGIVNIVKNFKKGMK